MMFQVLCKVLFLFLVKDDVVNLIEYIGDYWIDSCLEPCCDVFTRVLKATVCDDFIIHLTKFCWFRSTVISSFWPLTNAVSCSIPFPNLCVKVLCNYSARYWYLAISLHNLSDHYTLSLSHQGISLLFLRLVHKHRWCWYVLLLGSRF